MKQVGIIGQGYVGLALAFKIAKAGHSVLGFDTNEEIIKSLNDGKSHIEDVSSSDMQDVKSSGFYTPINDPKKLSTCQIIIIAVPTPLDSAGLPELKFIKSAVQIISSIFTKEILIINESTSYPGTLRIEIADEIYKKSGINHKYAAAPERIDPGNKEWRIENTPRVISGLSKESTQEAVDFYLSFTKSVTKVSTPEVAEMAKLVENSFRQVNIAFVNELSQITHSMGLDIDEVLDAAATKPYGFMRFKPGAGVGGHCIPIDPMYLNYSAKKISRESSLISLSDQINSSMPSYIVSRIKKDHGNSLVGKKIVVIGIAYKPDTSDIRESPSLRIIDLLRSEGANVTWNDEVVKTLKSEKSEEIQPNEIAVVVTMHTGIEIDEILKVPYIFDCTNKIKKVNKL
jgi:UDP-N-acetyl-D-glucosamine dehydrogenase